MKNVKHGHTNPIVCLDAGHYGKYNRSKVVPAYYESDMNWKLHLKLKAELEKYGIEVRITRADKDKDLALETRGKASKDCDLFLSLHSNAADSESVNYVVCMYQVDDNCSIDDESKELAEKLSKCVAGIMGGVKAKTWDKLSSADRDGNGYKDDYYGVLRGAHSVGTAGVIIEHGFHTNTAQAKWLLEEANLDKLAKAEAALIAEYYGMTKTEEKPAAEPEHWYRIRKTWADAKSQTSAYKNLDGAKKACPVGYFVFDWNGEVVYMPAPKEKTYTIELPVLRNGDKGNFVRAFQNLLLANNIKLPRYGADGDFGGETEAGVIAYQKANELSTDGTASKETVLSLLGII